MRITFLLAVLTPLIVACGQTSQAAVDPIVYQTPQELEHLSQATLGAGCFWCVEAIFQELEGIEKVESGYTGGHTLNPTYKDICTGTTGHAEVARIYFDEKVVSFAEILEVFFATHDPTTMNQQGADRGTQYRSVIFYHDDEQKRIADLAFKAANESGAWPNPVVTEISPLPTYYPAENYHQNYYSNNSEAAYCRAVIAPKLDKFHKEFRDKLKTANQE